VRIGPCGEENCIHCRSAERRRVRSVRHPQYLSYPPSLVQGTLNFRLLATGTTLWVYLDLVFLFTPSEAHSRNTFITCPPSILHSGV